MGRRALFESPYRWSAFCVAWLTCAPSPPFAQGQSKFDDYPPLCLHKDEIAASQQSPVTAAVGPISWYTIGEAALVVEYPTAYSVHTPLNPSQPIRSQPGAFFVSQVLEDIECFVDPADYDFVLMYSVQELPGWIHSGSRGIPVPAKNIGLPNSQYGIPSAFPAWPRLLLAPHMNSIQLITQPGAPDFGLHTAMHEMGHAWGVYWAMDSQGPRGWEADDPVAWLASCCAHWSWNWVGEELPGMMYSAPTNPRFNEFDLYAMGLKSHAEVQGTAFEVYEDSGTSAPGPSHLVDLDDLLFSLWLKGGPYYEGDGKRIPSLDSQATELNALIVVIKGASESISPAHEAAIVTLAEELPGAWFEATAGRSTLSVGMMRSSAVDQDEDAVLDCIDNCPEEQNPLQTDLDDDGMGDVCDACPHISNPSLWDLDHRQGFNLRDFQVFQECFSGPLPLTPGCGFVDFSGGGKIDLSDYVPVGELMTGACE